MVGQELVNKHKGGGPSGLDNAALIWIKVDEGDTTQSLLHWRFCPLRTTLLSPPFRLTFWLLYNPPRNIMATLHSLPTELLHQIFDLILPADIENFACVSRAIYLMSASVLAKHKALIRKYHKLEETEPDESIVGVLRDVLNQPRVGHYVREIELGLLQESEGGGMLLGKKDVDAFTEAAHELRLTFPWRDRTVGIGASRLLKKWPSLLV